MKTDSSRRGRDPKGLISHYERHGAIAMPLTVDQHQMLNAGHLNVNWFNFSLLLQFDAHVDSGLMRRALEYVFDHHDSFSVRVVNDEGSWRQFMVRDAESYCFHYADHSGLESEERYNAFDSLSMEMAQGLDISAGPLVRVAFIECGGSMPADMLCVMHHIAFDAVSLRILIDDLAAAYAQLAESGTVEMPPRTMHIQTWANKLHRFANSVQLRGEIDYWHSLPWDRAVALPADNPMDPEKNTVASGCGVECVLSPEETETLMIDFVLSQRISAPDVMIAVLVMDVTRWAGGEWLSLYVHDSGRDVLTDVPQAALAHTTGWLSFQRVLMLKNPDINGDVNLLKVIGLIKKQVEAVPNDGMGYQLLRHCSDDPAVRYAMERVPQPQISFNYVGMLGEYITSGPWRFGEDYGLLGERWTHPEHKQDEMLSCVAQISGNRFRFTVGYSDRIFERETVQRLVDRMGDTLRRLVRCCSAAA